MTPNVSLGHPLRSRLRCNVSDVTGIGVWPRAGRRCSKYPVAGRATPIGGHFSQPVFGQSLLHLDDSSQNSGTTYASDYWSIRLTRCAAADFAVGRGIMASL